MSHVDDGTLHTYLDGELAPTEAQGIAAHVAQCPACRGRLEEERALIRRAGELLALAAPPDRDLPPFRAGDVTPLARLWWRVRLPLAWAATVVLALGIGTYLGSGLDVLKQSHATADTEPAQRRTLQAPVAPLLAERESRAKPERAVRSPPPTPPAPPAPRAPPQAVRAAEEHEARVNASPISVDSARRLLGADPLAVPGLPVRAIHAAREIGYSALVIVEQALDSNRVIEVITGRRTPLALDQVTVTSATAARPETATPPEQALMGRAAPADSPAASSRNRSPRRMAAQAADRPNSELLWEVRGPLSADSLAALRRSVAPLRP